MDEAEEGGAGRAVGLGGGLRRIEGARGQHQLVVVHATALENADVQDVGCSSVGGM